jgi:hypothetical protein
MTALVCARSAALMASAEAASLQTSFHFRSVETDYTTEEQFRVLHVISVSLIL